MAHFMPEHMGREIDGVGTFKLQVEGVGLDAVDHHGMVDGVVREILHVRPQNGSPCSRAAFDDKAHIVDVAVAIAVKDHVVVNQIQRVHITEGAGQQLSLSPANADHHLLILMITDGICRAIRFKISTRLRILIRDNLPVLNVVGIDRVVMEMVVCHRLIEIIDAEITRGLGVEHRVDVVK